MADTSDTPRGGDRRRLLTIAIIVATIIVVAVVVTAFRTPRDDDPVAKAISLLGQESRFDSSRQAVESFAGVYQHLVVATKRFPKDCEVAAGKGQCLALNQAASWSLNTATASGPCTQPAIQEGRIALLDYVTTASGLDDAVTEPPPLPPIPTC